MTRAASAALALLVAAPGAGATQPPPDPLEVCTRPPSGDTPLGTATCANTATEQAERNQAAALRRLTAMPAGLPAAAVAAAQQAWQRYRDAHCALFDLGGSQAPASVALCRLDLSLRRVREIEGLLDEAATR